MVSKPDVYSLSTLLTEARIDKLTNRGGARPLFVRDTRLTGFGLKVTPTDAKSFFVEARRPRRYGGGVSRVTLGRYPFKPLQEARGKAFRLQVLLRVSGTSRTYQGNAQLVPRFVRHVHVDGGSCSIFLRNNSWNMQLDGNSHFRTVFMESTDRISLSVSQCVVYV